AGCSSEIRGDAALLPVAVPDGVRTLAATDLLRALVRAGLATALLRFLERALGGRSEPPLRGRRFGLVGHGVLPVVRILNERLPIYHVVVPRRARHTGAAGGRVRQGDVDDEQLYQDRRSAGA